MLPGPTRIIACPKCGELARVYSWLSGNTFCAQLWSDGKMVAPMMPEESVITRCHACGGLFWVSDAPQVGQISAEPELRGSIPYEWSHAENIRELSEGEYLQAIAGGLGKPRKREVYLRVRAWWAGNDRYRSSDQAQPGEPIHPRSPDATANLERLFKLLRTKNPNERLMKGEVARQLGRFKEAWDILWFEFPREYLHLAAFLRDLIRAEDTIVRAFPQIGSKQS